ncbi:hypothetical protein ACHHYP_15642 [Achlya hypogyna]|uniref:AAA+ ATPase domain-containing protein n=1 Tax=Achlya hypogyna TaxID=1202772 RepID=A0A1V9YAE8_ACHHY|nr:hypothetical protein ACHHYP_15642 [Achlya hypogyna]
MNTPRATAARRARADGDLSDVSPPRAKRPTTETTRDSMSSPTTTSMAWPPASPRDSDGDECDAYVAVADESAMRHACPGSSRFASPVLPKRFRLTSSPPKSKSLSSYLLHRKTTLQPHYTLKLHPVSVKGLSPEQRAEMESRGLDAIGLSPSVAKQTIARDHLEPIAAWFHVPAVGTGGIKLEYKNRMLYTIDTTKCGVLVNKSSIASHVRRQLHPGDIIQLLPAHNNKPPLRYVVCKRMHGRDSKIRLAPRPRRQLHSKQSTIVVFAASPLAGMDRYAKFHHIKSLPTETDYNLITSSIHDAGKASGSSPSIRVTVVPGMLEELQHTATLQCQVLHFMGRGSASSVYFEDNLSLVHPVPYAGLQRNLAGGTCSFRLVVLSYDHPDALVATFLAMGVPHVIVVPECAPPVHAALITTLYRGLAKRKSVEQAFHLAAQAAAELSEDGADKLVLLPAGANHNEVLFELEPPRKLRPRVQPRPTPLYPHLPVLCEGFRSRNMDLFKLSKLLSSKRRFITITGPSGIGKSLVAKALARHLSLRTRWVLGLSSPVRYCHVPSVVAATPAGTTRWDHLYHVSETLEGTDQYGSSDRSLLSELARSQHSWPSVLILDDCDALTTTEADRLAFRELLVEWLRKAPELQIVCTARSTITKSCLIPNYPEIKHALGPLSPTDAAELLLFWIQRRESSATRHMLDQLAADDAADCQLQLEFAGMSISPVSSPRHARDLASHPVLLAAAGNPRTIVRLALLPPPVAAKSMPELE